jgi:RNA polymerase-binding transcription factor DksA
VDKIESALQGELHDTIVRLRDLGGAVTFEDPGGPEGVEEAAEAGGDAACIGEERELSFAVRSRLVERANRLAEALDRLRHGTYGACEICGDRIAPARLRVFPEATTCVACQGAEEGRARHGAYASGMR